MVLAAIICAAPLAARAQQAPPSPRNEPPAAPRGHDMHDMHGMSDTTADSAKRPAAAGSMAMPGMHDGMAMPIPMPKGMPMMPGLVGLVPPVTPFLPGAGVDPARLPEAKPAELTPLKDGDTLDLNATMVRRTLKGRAVVMYGFNGQVPGPLIRVPQNATITVRFHNRIDLPSAVHWHGVRLDNRSDGVPGVTQEAVAPGGSFVYHVHFPDAGLYWYHPHVREDIEQAMGLFGNLLVDAPDPEYYSPANREQVLILDDLLVNADTLVSFGKEGPDFALMGRVGNLLLVNGEPRYTLRVKMGEVVRFYLTNASSARTYNLSFGSAAMKVLASDVSRFEREEWVRSVVLAPAERYIVEVRFDRPGRYALVNAVQAINHYRGEFEPEVDTLGMVTVDSAPATPDYGRQFATLRANAAVSRDIDRYRPYFDKAPDKQLTLTVRTNALPLATVQFMTIDTAYYAPVEWVDGMPDMNWLSTSAQVQWIIRDDATGKENVDIDWHVAQGSVVKLRIVNDPKSFHPMQHPIHLHGQRMLVVARDGVATRNLVWKDTAIIPVGSTVDLLIDASNPGDWMLHCHIAEHLGAGMMTVLHVDPPSGARRK
ncbi:MAG: multicopper oxidase family protein [Gemmatimonadaceae bacterium]|nr:multicopper oxidase family protein [Gemmatimonadaceae bacterium]